VPNASPYVRDAFHEFVVEGRADAVNPNDTGTKAAGLYHLDLGPGECAEVRMRLWRAAPTEKREDGIPATERGFRPGVGEDFDEVFAARLAEADDFYAHRVAPSLPEACRRVARQAYAGLMWNKQF